MENSYICGDSRTSPESENSTTTSTSPSLSEVPNKQEHNTIEQSIFKSLEKKNQHFITGYNCNSQSCNDCSLSEQNMNFSEVNQPRLENNSNHLVQLQDIQKESRQSETEMSNNLIIEPDRTNQQSDTNSDNTEISAQVRNNKNSKSFSHNSSIAFSYVDELSRNEITATEKLCGISNNNVEENEEIVCMICGDTENIVLSSITNSHESNISISEDSSKHEITNSSVEYDGHTSSVSANCSHIVCKQCREDCILLDPTKESIEQVYTCLFCADKGN